MARRGDAKVRFNADDNVSKVMRQIGRNTKRLTQRYHELSGGFKNTLQIAGMMKRGLVDLGRAAAVPIQKAMEQERVERQLETVLRSTGEAAGFNKKQLLEMASAYQRTTKFGDEAVIGAENVLLTFTNIKKADGVFERTTGLVLDMATALKTDLKDQAIQVGKALNDPVLGLTALQRVGVSFTKEQKELIKSLVETGETAKAQTIILDELAREFGGSAAAQIEDYGGAVAQLENAYGDLQEEIGQFITQNAGIQGLIRETTDYVLEFVETIDASESSFNEQVAAAEVARDVLVQVLEVVKGLTLSLGFMADMTVDVVEMLAKLRGELVPKNEAQRALKGLIDDQKALRDELIATQKTVVVHGREWGKLQVDIQTTNRNIAALTKGFHQAAGEEVSFYEKGLKAAEGIDGLIRRLQDYDIEAAQFRKSLRLTQEYFEDTFGWMWNGFSGGPVDLARQVEPLTIDDILPPQEDFEKDAEERARAAAEQIRKLIEEEASAVDALARPAADAFADAFADSLAGSSRLSDGWASFTDELKGQMSHALVDPIFGAESAMMDLARGVMQPLRMVGQAINQSIIQPLINQVVGFFVTKSAAEFTASKASAALHVEQAAVIAGTTNAATKAIMPGLAAAAALSLVATGGSSGSAALLLPVILGGAEALATAVSSSLPALAEGGRFTSPLVALIGEDGAETLIPETRPDRARPLLADLFAREPELFAGIGGTRGGGGSTVTNFIELTVIAGDADAEEVAERTARELDALLGRQVGSLG